MLTEEDAKEIGEDIGIDWDSAFFTPAELLEGIEIEDEEHGTANSDTDVTGGDLSLAAKIAWAHLLESPDYYMLLSKMEKEYIDG